MYISRCSSTLASRWSGKCDRGQPYSLKIGPRFHCELNRGYNIAFLTVIHHIFLSPCAGSLVLPFPFEPVPASSPSLIRNLHQRNHCSPFSRQFSVAASTIIYASTSPSMPVRNLRSRICFAPAISIVAFSLPASHLQHLSRPPIPNSVYCCHFLPTTTPPPRQSPPFPKSRRSRISVSRWLIHISIGATLETSLSPPPSTPLRRILGHIFITTDVLSFFSSSPPFSSHDSFNLGSMLTITISVPYPPWMILFPYLCHIYCTHISFVATIPTTLSSA